ncbi:hypothetical protein [Caldilinea sp.]|uniref:hypothetical protein n=1 Tax=Caldilinea sp. TaxID=2293560 RepID=UPI002BA599CF|nr:hypothetical protein [Anaerolineales bacterium]HQY91723.1 hypothetical protein [Caldilinea sp.]
MLHTPIGKIVKSNSHIDYVCQVFGVGETPLPPTPEDYCFGAFVAVELETTSGAGATLVGLIYNTLLMNPEFGALGPRLSPRNEVEIFSPDYLAETATLLGVISIGWLDAAGRAHQGVPALAATVNCPVRPLAPDEVIDFHADKNGQPQLRYAPQLLAQNHALVAPLLLAVLDRLGELFPQSRGRLAVMRNNVAWKSIVQPAG